LHDFHEARVELRRLGEQPVECFELEAAELHIRYGIDHERCGLPTRMTEEISGMQEPDHLTAPVFHDAGKGRKAVHDGSNMRECFARISQGASRPVLPVHLRILQPTQFLFSRPCTDTDRPNRAARTFGKGRSQGQFLHSAPRSRYG